METNNPTTPEKPRTTSSDIMSPSCFFQSSEVVEKSSPSYVKWDFDLPTVSDEIKSEAKQLGQEITEDILIRRNNMRKSPYYPFKMKRLKKESGEMTPRKKVSYYKAMNLLLKTIENGSGSSNKEDIGSSNKEDANNICLTDNITENIQRLDPIELFDDSYNDDLMACSQSVENSFKTSNLLNDSYNVDGENISNISKLNGRKALNELQINENEDKKSRSCFQEIEELDDDYLFLQVDI